MGKRYDFFNPWHLGDALYQLHYMLRLWAAHAVPSTLYCDPAYHSELSQFIPDGYDVRLAPLEARPADAINCWIGHEDFYYNHPDRRTYNVFYGHFFKYLSERHGLPVVISCAEDMRFDSPRIMAQNIPPDRYDFLIINAEPKSFQWEYDPWDFHRLAVILKNARMKVVTTHPVDVEGVPATTSLGWTIAQIAKLSTQVTNIVAVETGPHGPTFNLWNKDVVNRMILHQENTFSGAGIISVKSREGIWPSLKKLRPFIRTTR